MHTLWPSGDEPSLGKAEITVLEELLETRFTNIATFLKQDERKRIFENLLQNHSIIKLDHLDGSHTDYSKYPICIFQPLQMFIIDDYENSKNDLIEFKVDGKTHHIIFDDELNDSEMFQEINEKMTDKMFVCLDLGHSSEAWGTIYNERLFIVPSSIDLEKLTSIIGYTGSKSTKARHHPRNAEA